MMDARRPERQLRQRLQSLSSAASLAVEAFLGARKVNGNFICGLILMVIGIACCWVKLFFNPKNNFPLPVEIVELSLKGNVPLPEGYWYYTNWHFFFVGLGSHLLTLFAFSAGILWTEKKVIKLLYLLPIGYEVANIPWLLMARCDAEYNAVPNIHFFFTAGLFILVVILSFRFWLDRKYHKYDGICARIAGLATAPDIDPTTRERLMAELFNELKFFHSKY